MGAVIGELLPLGVGVALSPIPIIAIILMLLGPRAGTTGLGFLVGWVVGIAGVTTVVAVVGGTGPMSDDGGPSSAASVVKLALGALALLLAGRNWQQRPKPGETPTLPAWLAAIDTMTAAKAVGLGLLLAAANPKNLAFLLGAGIDLGTADLAMGTAIGAGAIFVAVAASTVLLPVVGYRIAGERIQPVLVNLKEWLSVNNATVMMVVLAVLGTTLVGKGIAGLTT